MNWQNSVGDDGKNPHQRSQKPKKRSYGLENRSYTQMENEETLTRSHHPCDVEGEVNGRKKTSKEELTHTTLFDFV